MKTIKLFFLVLITSVTTSCIKFKPSQADELSLKNGEDKEVQVKYEIAKLNYKHFTSVIKTKTELQSIAEQASSQAKMNCKFMPTYEPKELSLMASQDTITVFVTFNAKNAFGTTGSDVLIIKFKGTTYIGHL